MDKAIELIKEFEGLRTTAYQCQAGIWTIGWGHTDGIKRGDTISVDEAERLLCNDVANLRSLIREQLHGTQLTDNQEAALLSFAFNVGFAALLRSTLWRKVCCNPNDTTIANEFARWKYAGGKVLPGLIKRRAKEAATYFAQ